MSEVEFIKQEPEFAAFLAMIGRIKSMCGACTRWARRSGKAESWSIARKRWRPGSVSCAKDSPIVGSRWRWSNHEEL